MADILAQILGVAALAATLEFVKAFIWASAFALAYVLFIKERE